MKDIAGKPIKRMVRVAFSNTRADKLQTGVVVGFTPAERLRISNRQGYHTRKPENVAVIGFA